MSMVESRIEDQEAPMQLGPNELDLLSRFFVSLKRCIKLSTFNSHRTAEHESYILPAYELLQEFLARFPAVDVKLEVSSYLVAGSVVLEDDGPDLNIIYPLWQAGVHLLSLKRGITPSELQRFYMTVADHKQQARAEELTAALWQQEFEHVECVVIRDFSVDHDDDAEDDDGEEEDEAQLDNQVEFLKEAVGTDAFARVSLPNLSVQLSSIEQVRHSVVLPTGAPVMLGTLEAYLESQLSEDDRRVMVRISKVFLSVMELPIDAAGIQDLELAFELLLEGLVLRGDFAALDAFFKGCEDLGERADLPEANQQFGRTATATLKKIMLMPKLIKEIEEGLNMGRFKELDGVESYLSKLDEEALEPLAHLIGVLEQPFHRRMVTRAVEGLGSACIPVVSKMIAGCSAEVAREILYLFKRFPAPDRAELLAPLLQHEDGPVRMEALEQVTGERSDVSLTVIREVFESHRVPQMRAAAGRILLEQAPDLAEPIFLKLVDAPGFGDRPEGERRAVLRALVSIDSVPCIQRIEKMFEEKSKLIGGAKIDERKLETIAALQATPTMSILTLLETLARDEERIHSKDVRTAARLAAEEMWRKFTGTAAAADDKADT